MRGRAPLAVVVLVGLALLAILPPLGAIGLLLVVALGTAVARAGRRVVLGAGAVVVVIGLAVAVIARPDESDIGATITGTSAAQLADARTFGASLDSSVYSYGDALRATLELLYLDPKTAALGEIAERGQRASARLAEAKRIELAWDALIRSMDDTRLSRAFRSPGAVALPLGPATAQANCHGTRSSLLGDMPPNCGHVSTWQVAPLSADVRAVPSTIERALELMATGVNAVRGAAAATADTARTAVRLAYDNAWTVTKAAGAAVAFGVGATVLGPPAGAIGFTFFAVSGTSVALSIARGTTAVSVAMGVADPKLGQTIALAHEKVAALTPVAIIASVASRAIDPQGRTPQEAREQQAAQALERVGDLGAVFFDPASAQRLTDAGFTTQVDFEGVRVHITPTPSQGTFEPIGPETLRSMFRPGTYLVNDTVVNVTPGPLISASGDELSTWERIAADLDRAARKLVADRPRRASPSPTAAAVARPSPSRTAAIPATPRPTPTPDPLARFDGTYRGNWNVTSAFRPNLTFEIRGGRVTGSDFTKVDSTIADAAGVVYQCTVVTQLDVEATVQPDGRIVGTLHGLVTQKCTPPNDRVVRYSDPLAAALPEDPGDVVVGSATDESGVFGFRLTRR